MKNKLSTGLRQNLFYPIVKLFGFMEHVFFFFCQGSRKIKMLNLYIFESILITAKSISHLSSINDQTLMFVCLLFFNGTSAFLGYLMPNPSF